MLSPTRDLFRPVGLYELRLIQAADYRAFPPRLAMQPIFYPVLNLEYAIQIARDWNTKDIQSGYMGVATRFSVEAAYLDQFAIQTVGAIQHQELWIPADELEEFNRHIQGQIQIEAAFYGEKFEGVREW
jgi:hypothetical protein